MKVLSQPSFTRVIIKQINDWKVHTAELITLCALVLHMSQASSSDGFVGTPERFCCCDELNGNLFDEPF